MGTGVRAAAPAVKEQVAEGGSGSRCNTREATVETLLGHRTPAQTRRTIGHADNCARCDLLWSIVLDEIREAAR